MLLQLGRFDQRLAAVEVLRRRAQHQGHSTNVPAHETCIVHRPRDPDGHVESLVDGIDETIIEDDFDANVGIPLQELDDHRPQVLLAEAHRCVDAQSAGGSLLKILHRGQCFVQVAQNDTFEAWAACP